jgi:hypothetical protein
MDELPTDLDTLLEAVEGMMGEEFADMLEGSIHNTIARAEYSVFSQTYREVVLPILTAPRRNGRRFFW